MQIRNKPKELWRQGKPAAAAWISTTDTLVTEAMAEAGFDAMVLDMQHGFSLAPDRAGPWIQFVAALGVTPWVRVPWNDPVWMQWALDAGALGVIVPLVNTYDEACRAGAACRYWPLGGRSAAGTRVKYRGGSDYFQMANDEIACLVMIEHIDTIPRLDEIAQAPGIDGFYIGPSDLAITMGLGPGQDNRDPRHVEVVQQVLDAANRHGLVAGMHCSGPEEVTRRFKQGFKFCPVTSEMRLIESGAKEALKIVRDALGD